MPPQRLAENKPHLPDSRVYSSEYQPLPCSTRESIQSEFPHLAAAPPPSFKSIMTKWLKSLGNRFAKMPRACPEPTKQFEGSLFERLGTVKTRIGGVEHKASAIIKFDTGSDYNIVSERFLKREFPSLRYDGEPNKIFAKSASGKELLVSKGTVSLAWNCPRSISPPEGGPHFRPRFEKATFYVIEAEDFELLLGHPDIQSLNIFTFNQEPLGTVSTVFIAPLDLGSNVAQEDADAADRREREKQEAKERKKKIKEEKAKKKKK